MILYSTFNESFDELMFNHNMECLYLEQNIVNDVLQLRYNGFINTESVEIINESVLETIKKAILAIFQKIKELFNKVIDFFRGAKQKEQEKKVEEELKKCESILNGNNVKSSPSSSIKQNEPKTTDFELVGKPYGDSNIIKNNKPKQQSSVQQLPSFTTRTIKVYNLNGFGLVQPLLNSLTNSAIYQNIERLDELRGNISDRRRSRYTDFDDSDRDCFIIDFYSLVADRFAGSARFVRDELVKDLNGATLPPYLKELVNKELDHTINRTFDNEDEFKRYVHTSIKSEIFHIKHQKMLTEDLEKCKNHISKLENQVRSIKNDNHINQEQMNNLLSMVNLLQTLINNTIPLRVTLSTKITRNMYHNLRVFNKIAEEFGINKF